VIQRPQGVEAPTTARDVSYDPCTGCGDFGERHTNRAATTTATTKANREDPRGTSNARTRTTPQRAILPSITVAPETNRTEGSSLDANAILQEVTTVLTRYTESESAVLEECREYRAVIQALSEELKECQKDSKKRKQWLRPLLLH